ncbi:MAG: Prephenate and/or arogenate dehydrogenase (unknown specificity) (EC (EC [uncultured Sulfurovum sp.]|uniref:Prephenate/arogenate dehydrogenase domain-containing protein n=1 Tax=uncultured Sulfurovum sp. TaxID=269237 RepID=A0A6S6U338_9BACT|nr:MAG: Prephenate and/or arogenate dehydrogenase (unknown specificity) (EC (EC [uncultured Sulfurovum sp.]
MKRDFKMNVGIVGLGLMGGSLSLALKKFPNKYALLGYDHNPTHRADALRLNLVDSISSDFSQIEACDIIILTIPVDAIIATAQNLKKIQETCTVIDFGSSKEKISKSIPQEIRQNFVTAHPMTGTEKFGPSAAIEGLYNEKTMVICDIEKSAAYQKGIALDLFKDIQAKIVFMGAKEHDRHAAFISHMPHAVSYALAQSVMKQEDPKSILALAGGGFKSMSRIAKSSPNMWEDIFRQNKENLLESIEAFNREMKLCQKLLEEEKWDELHQWMHDANKLHDTL